MLVGTPPSPNPCRGYIIQHRGSALCNGIMIAIAPVGGSYMSQSLSKIYVHLVFSTKGRTDTIPKQHLLEVHAYVAEIFNNHGCPAIQVGGTANHIHILFLLGKTTDLSEIVRTVKSSTSVPSFFLAGRLWRIQREQQSCGCGGGVYQGAGGAPQEGVVPGRVPQDMPIVRCPYRRTLRVGLDPSGVK